MLKEIEWGLWETDKGYRIVVGNTAPFTPSRYDVYNPKGERIDWARSITSAIAIAERAEKEEVKS